MKKRFPFVRVLFSAVLPAALAFLLAAGQAWPQDGMNQPAEQKGSIPTEHEEALRQEEERLEALRKDVEERIAQYTALLNKIEETLKTLGAVKNERLEHLVKVYESMPSEEAAAKLSALDEATAISILSKMKSKKAGTVMASMDSQKAAELTEKMMARVKNFPAR